MPVIKLKTVVFPAPLGPITLTICRGQILRSTSCTAARPPKYFVTLLNSRSGLAELPSKCSTLIEHPRLAVIQHGPPLRTLPTRAVHPANRLLPAHRCHVAIRVA